MTIFYYAYRYYSSFSWPPRNISLKYGKAHLQGLYVSREWYNFVYLYSETALMYIVYASGTSFSFSALQEICV